MLKRLIYGRVYHFGQFPFISDQEFRFVGILPYRNYKVPPKNSPRKYVALIKWPDTGIIVAYKFSDFETRARNMTLLPKNRLAVPLSPKEAEYAESLFKKRVDRSKDLQKALDL